MVRINNRPMLVLNRFEIKEGHIGEAEELWSESRARRIMRGSVLYKGLVDNTLVLLYEVDDFADLQSKIEGVEYREFAESVAALMSSDFHQEIAGLAETVVPRKALVPSTPFMQLRHIEVPLSGIGPYLDWRRRRIFEYVRRNDRVHSFLAFHSIFSANPGVTFIVEFLEDPDSYRESFMTPEYRQIVSEANHDHIKGGLYTAEFRLSAAPL